jgi:dipeptidyl-peptidase 4
MKKSLFIVLLLPSLVAFGQGTKKFTLEDIFKNRKFASKQVSGIHSMNNGKEYCQLKKDSLNMYDYLTGKLTNVLVTSMNLVPAGDTTPIEMGDFEFSKDESKILFATDEEPIYRHSTISRYYIYDIAKKKLSLLADTGKQRLATFSPDGTKFAFVRDNDIFMKDLATNKEIRVTNDGKVNEIINGATDWVYEEEFAFSKAFEWSPDSKKLAYYRFDESRVKEYELTIYGDLYPQHEKYKYPKAGEDNSKIGLYIWNTENGKRTAVDIGKETDIYIPRIKWTTDPDILAIYRLNRHQNKLEILLAKAKNGTTEVIYTEENKCYIEINDNWFFLKDGRGFLLTSEKDGFRHIYLYDMSGKMIRQLTSGNFEVTDIEGIDEKNGILYYVSTEISPLNRDIYSIKFDGTAKTRLSRRDGTNSADFSSSYEYYIQRWSDINTPPVVTVNKANGEEVRVMQDNKKLRDLLSGYAVAKTTFFTFRTRDQVELNGWMLKPADFDSTKKYPVLFTIYGGPGSQTVLNSWGAVSSWNKLLVQEGIILVSVDNRGTGGRGESFKKSTYLELGKYETSDQIEAAEYLGTLPYVDKTRIGMWGWSYGGFMTLSALTKGADNFSMGVAVAPVTNWKYYDNIYTERYMRTPKENPDGYETNSPIYRADGMKGKLLIIHGMADDNVHTQNSYDFITALVAANKHFDEQFYPNSNHGIYTGKNTTFHLYSLMTDYIIRNLAGDPARH